MDRAKALRPDLPGPWRWIAAIARWQAHYYTCIDASTQALCIAPGSPNAPSVRRIQRSCTNGLLGERTPLGSSRRRPHVECKPIKLTQPPLNSSSSSVAIALLIDRSGSMAGPKMNAAKLAAKAAVRALQRADLVAVLTFNMNTRVAVPIQRRRNGKRIGAAINRLSAGGGTNLAAALQTGYRLLGSADARKKHLILLTDGQAPEACVEEPVTQMAASGITLSTVALGDADQELLKRLAKRGRGRFHKPATLALLPALLTVEIQHVTVDQ